MCCCLRHPLEAQEFSDSIAGGLVIGTWPTKGSKEAMQLFPLTPESVRIWFSMESCLKIGKAKGDVQVTFWTLDDVMMCWCCFLGWEIWKMSGMYIVYDELTLTITRKPNIGLPWYTNAGMLWMAWTCSKSGWTSHLFTIPTLEIPEILFLCSQSQPNEAVSSRLR